MQEENLEIYFESIDFLPLGEKIADLNKAIEATRTIRKKRTAKVLEKFRFLKKAKPEELERAAGLLRKKLKDEVEKMEEMQAVFREFNSRIKNSRIKAIAYPDGIRIHESQDSKFRPMFYFTSSGMAMWYLRVGERRPFKTHSWKAEEMAIRVRAFGIAGWEKSRGGQFYEVLYVQPLVFFRKDIEDRPEGRGLEQPLPKVHLLMVFLLLKKAKEE